MLHNAYLLAKIGADTAENERNFAEILPKFGRRPEVALLRLADPDGLGLVVLRRQLIVLEG